MDAKKIAMILGIGILLPLFLGFFVDAIYAEPKYEDYCKNQLYTDYKQPLNNVNCSDYYSTPQARECLNGQGQPVPRYDANNCPVYESCDYCQKDFNTTRGLYNRNVFFILAPIGLAIVILGIYFTVDYIGAGLMFGGLATMFYATVRYFSDMSKLLRALVLLFELIVIIYIGYKKIEDNAQNRKGKRK